MRIRIRNLYADPDPDPTAQINADPDPDTDPEPKPWLFVPYSQRLQQRILNLDQIRCTPLCQK